MVCAIRSKQQRILLNFTNFLFSNVGEYYTATYHAALSAYVSIIQVEFNLTKMMDSILLTDGNYTITATLSAEESTVLVSMFNSSLNLSLSHPASSVIIPQTSTDLTRETLTPSIHTSKFSSIAETTMTTYTCPSTVISTVTVDRVIISSSQEVLSTSSSLDEPFNSMSILIMSVAGGIFMILIITMVFLIILLRKTSKPNRPAIPGVTNPCQIPEIKGSF